MITLRTSYSLRLGEHPAKKFMYALGFNCFCKSRRNLLILAAIISNIFTKKSFFLNKDKFLFNKQENTFASQLAKSCESKTNYKIFSSITSHCGKCYRTERELLMKSAFQMEREQRDNLLLCR